MIMFTESVGTSGFEDNHKRLFYQYIHELIRYVVTHECTGDSEELGFVGIYLS